MYSLMEAFVSTEHNNCVATYCSFQTVVQYVDAQYDKYLKDETGLNRRNIVDHRVHCCFYFINPVGHRLVSVLLFYSYSYFWATSLSYIPFTAMLCLYCISLVSSP